MLNITLFFTIFEATIRVPFLENVPAAGLSVFELAQKPKDQYDGYFALPSMASMVDFLRSIRSILLV
jgi:hypothetical protein